MSDRLSKIITKGGDKGKTSIAGGTRLLKSSTRIHAIGDIDELNSSIGVLIAEIQCHSNTSLFETDLLSVQHDLFNLGGEIAMPDYEILQEEALTFIEDKANELNETLPPLKEFILPSGSRAVALAHMSRSICRRAERQIVQLSQEDETLRPLLLKFINRLSDYLFILARSIGQLDGQKEVLWQR
ncbi:cob(I)yrinic acid a,c-diamide adenosyltransferase [Litoribrevibacter albus]|uniref:Corrinoid adenosyltransferase n=1 Tax=Litoribrevibacter albus TaxID=1473156 RepID=A0AA37S7K5_9GAMM|nr:cob(I)yrinic acid a,c-diamide adenosyltransferase [Litoribrevibacter albus]GLQ29702.1 ATP--cobalamin adenosyltransferase [Litoribrevibacter albus]